MVDDNDVEVHNKDHGMDHDMDHDEDRNVEALVVDMGDMCLLLVYEEVNHKHSYILKSIFFIFI